MKKLLVVLTGLIGISTSSVPVFNSNQTKVNNQNYISPLALAQEWKTDAVVIKEDIKANQWLYFAIDNINLSSLGIDTIEKLHDYNNIEIPNFFVRFFGKSYVDINGDLWSAKHNIGSESWSRVFWKVADDVTMNLERASTIWINDSNQLMMRLAYHASISVAWPTETIGGVVTFKSGSLVKFY